MTTYTVMDYGTGDTIEGEASERLIECSLDAGDTGAVCAYRDATGVWQYVADSDADQHRALREDMRTVWVQED